MKGKFIVITLIMLMCLSSCSTGDTGTAAESQNDATLVVPSVEEPVTEDNTGEEDPEVDNENRAIIAKVLNLESNDRCIRFILSSLNTANTGKIRDAVVREEGPDKIVGFYSEDGTKYDLYLTKGNSITGLKNLDTNEWVIKSVR